MRKTKAIYLAGYLDTMATFEAKLKEQGIQNGLRDLKVVIDAVGIEGILAEAVNIKLERGTPLPLRMAEGLGAARKKVMKQ